MISTQDLKQEFGGRTLFKNVSVKFTPGNCYGLIGANGTGKSTLLKILAGEITPTGGDVSVSKGERLAMLRQDQFQFDKYSAVKTIIAGHKRLFDISEQKELLYTKPDFNDEDGILLSELEAEFAELDGWNAETEAEMLLNGLGVDSSYHYTSMAELDSGIKVKVLLAQALFGNPDILLLDEPTNNLDYHAVKWLENFLMSFENTVIVVSHDRHFLNKVCTHIADIDFSKITMYVGNYDFWYQYTQMIQRQLKEQQKKNDAKIKELREFIARFSANAAKSKQATSRKKLIDNLTMDNILPTSRKYPFIEFKPDREAGNEMLTVTGLSKTIGERKVLNNVNLKIIPGDKVAFIGSDELAATTLFRIITGEMEPDEGTYKWGITTSQSYFPKDNSAFFDNRSLNLLDWLRQFSTSQYESDIRGWLGRMLFSGDEALKEVRVLSGGERVRCMFAKMMLSGANTLIMDDPTNHLDLEAITALNEGLCKFGETILFTSHDHQFIQTVSNRIIEILPNGIIDSSESFDDYMDNERIDALREEYK